MTAPRWDLESILPGSPKTEPFTAKMSALEARLDTITAEADTLGDPAEDERWPTLLADLTELSEALTELFHYAWSFMAADTTVPDYGRAAARAKGAATRLERAWTRPRQLVATCPESSFALLKGHPELADYVSWFDHERRGAALLLPGEQQALAAELSDAALHQWGQLYEDLTGVLEAEIDGEKVACGQAMNRLDSEDRAQRQAAFNGIKAAFRSVAGPCAQALGTITAARDVINRRRGTDELAEPLHDAHIEAATLDAMLEICHEARPLMGRYFAAKARLLGLEKLDWYDLIAPVGAKGSTIGWDEGCQMVLQSFDAFSSDLGDLARRALAESWIEAEDRPGKILGGFCAEFPQARESRIFLTWSGRPATLMTVAHEIGHAYHNHVLYDVPPPMRQVPATLAETASTFAEALVRGHLLEHTTDDAERLSLIEKDLVAASTMLTNIPVRFLFEQRLFKLRAKGPLNPADLEAVMVELQREWYGPGLGLPNPIFWASKQHFYLTFQPFYNFPYTFGYLFSALVYAHSRQQGPEWTPRYRDLLLDTGSLQAEEVAMRHLGIDLRETATWRPVLADVAELVATYEELAG